LAPLEKKRDKANKEAKACETENKKQNDFCKNYETERKKILNEMEKYLDDTKGAKVSLQDLETRYEQRKQKAQEIQQKIAAYIEELQKCRPVDEIIQEERVANEQLREMDLKRHELEKIYSKNSIQGQ